MNDMDIIWWKERRESTKKQLLEGTMETVRILGEFYARGQLTPELIQAAYTREREKDRFLRLDLEACEAALLGKGYANGDAAEAARQSSDYNQYLRDTGDAA